MHVCIYICTPGVNPMYQKYENILELSTTEYINILWKHSSAKVKKEYFVQIVPKK